MSNLDLYNKVRSVPLEAQKKIDGGRLNGMTDISPMWRIKTLTEHFGACGDGWWYEITNKSVFDGANEEKVATVDIALYVKHGGVPSNPIYATGGSMLVAKERSGLHTNDEAFKMALTDAISVACKALGFGADIYWAKDRTKYDLQEKVEQAKQNTLPTVGLASKADLKQILEAADNDKEQAKAAVAAKGYTSETLPREVAMEIIDDLLAGISLPFGNTK